MSADQYSNVQGWLDYIRSRNHGGKDAVSPLDFHKRVNHVEENGQSVVVADHQTVDVVEGHSIQFLLPDNSGQTPTSFASAGQYSWFEIRNDVYPYLENPSLVLTLTESGGTNPVQTVPLPYLFTSIEFWAEGQFGKKIQTLYPETMFLYSLLLPNDSQKTRFGLALNYNGINGLNQDMIPEGGTVRWTLPLWGNFIKQNKGIFLPHLKNSLWVKLNYAVAPFVGGGYAAAVVVAGGVYGQGTCAITKIEMMLEILDLTTEDRKRIADDMALNIYQYNFLDTEKWSFTNQTITAGTTNKFELKQTQGLYSYFLTRLQATSTSFTNVAYNASITVAASEGLIGNFIKASHLGDYRNGGEWSFENKGGQIISALSPEPADWAPALGAATEYPGSFPELFNGWYLMAFGDILVSEDEAIRKGMRFFRGNEYLVLKPRASPVSETASVWTITLLASATGAAPAATPTVTGLFRLGLFGNVTKAISIGSDDVNVYQRACNEAMRSTIGFDGTPIICKVVLGQALIGFAASATSTITLTFSNLPKRIPEKNNRAVTIESTKLSDGTLGYTLSVVHTTAGVCKDGLSTTTYNLEITARKFVHCHILRDGTFEIQGFST